MVIKAIERTQIPECVEVIKNSFETVANEFGFTVKNAPRFTAFATTVERLYIGNMIKNIVQCMPTLMETKL